MLTVMCRSCAIKQVVKCLTREAAGRDSMNIREFVLSFELNIFSCMLIIREAHRKFFQPRLLSLDFLTDSGHFNMVQKLYAFYT